MCTIYVGFYETISNKLTQGAFIDNQYWNTSGNTNCLDSYVQTVRDSVVYKKNFYVMTETKKNGNHCGKSKCVV